MNYKIFLMFFMFSMCILALLSVPATSQSQYGKIDFYYNDQLVPNTTTPKPLLKIGEPFTLRFEVTSYKKCLLSARLTSIGNSDFDIIEGPTSSLNEGTRSTIEENETRVFEWIVAPNEEWAGGSTPINFYYQMTDLDTARRIISGEFTAAYVTISNEYYEGPQTSVEQSGDNSKEGDVRGIPGFGALSLVFALLAAVVMRRN